ncbi:hypothetical protein Mapa_011105 [Marchantia paleacea]|nr:hypothetical protein Mapa_011105 [Marchantia paleacea]
MAVLYLTKRESSLSNQQPRGFYSACRAEFFSHYVNRLKLCITHGQPLLLQLGVVMHMQFTNQAPLKELRREKSEARLEVEGKGRGPYTYESYRDDPTGRFVNATEHN